MFSQTQELQEKNAQLLAVTRQLGADAERDRAALRADLEAEAAGRAERLSAQIAQQREERLRQEVRACTDRWQCHQPRSQMDTHCACTRGYKSCHDTDHRSFISRANCITCKLEIIRFLQWFLGFLLGVVLLCDRVDALDL